MKKMISFSALALSIAIGPTLQARTIVHPAIKFVDGIKFALDGEGVVGLVHIIRELKVLLNGSKSKPGYLFEGKHYCLKDLPKVPVLINTAFQNGMISKTEYDAKMNEANHLLETVKTDFMNVALPFLEQAHGVKPLIVQLIEEWSDMVDRPTTFMLKWGAEEEGKEVEVFRRDMNSMQMLTDFCVDLIEFMEDLIESCPNGLEQFKEIMQKRKKK